MVRSTIDVSSQLGEGGPIPPPRPQGLSKMEAFWRAVGVNAGPNRRFSLFTLFKFCKTRKKLKRDDELQSKKVIGADFEV